MKLCIFCNCEIVFEAKFETWPFLMPHLHFHLTRSQDWSLAESPTRETCLLALLYCWGFFFLFLSHQTFFIKWSFAKKCVFWEVNTDPVYGMSICLMALKQLQWALTQVCFWRKRTINTNTRNLAPLSDCLKAIWWHKGGLKTSLLTNELQYFPCVCKSSETCFKN